MIVKYLFHDRF